MGCSRKEKKPQLSDKLLNHLYLSLRIQLQETSRKRDLSFKEYWLAFEKNTGKENFHNLLVYNLEALTKI